MSKNLSLFFKELCENFFKINDDTEQIILYSRNNQIISEEKREEIKDDATVDYSSLVKHILAVIIEEFEFNKFGTAVYENKNNTIIFISINKDIALCIITKSYASIDKVNAYAYFLAEKIAQILYMNEGDIIELSIPKFDFDIKNKEILKNQIYESRPDLGKNYRYKFIIIGDAGVGKTSIVRRFTENKFTHDYRATIGLNIVSHNMTFFGNELDIAIWDLGAQKDYEKVRKTYYQNSQAVFIVFDLTNRETYDNVINWYNELNDFIDTDHLSVVVIGNKLDLKESRKVEYQEGVEITKKLSTKGISTISYIETSALSGDNIIDAFRLISYHYILKNKEFEEKISKNEIYEILKLILTLEKKLTISFITENKIWSPGLQILAKIAGNQNLAYTKEESNYLIYEYKNGLILKNYFLENIEIDDSDAVFCLFDARNRKDLDSKWKKAILTVLEQIKEKKVVLIGFQIDENTDWSNFMRDFNINDFIEKKKISLLSFRIGENYRMEIYEKLKLMFNSIENTL